MKKTVIKNCWVIFISINIFAQQNFFTTNQNASLMLSGVGFNNTGGALQLNHPNGIATDGTRFLLCDRFNNRVLIWKTLPTKWDSPPDIVLGQDSMTHNLSDSSLGGLNFPGNVSASKNGIVAVADTYNDRILIWKTFPEKNKQKADVVISLPKLTPQGSQMKYGWPWGVWTDGTKLAAVATHGSTILFWNSIPISNDQKPDYKITHQHFGTPRNISTDGSTFFFVGDHNAKANGDRAGTFFWNTYPTTENQTYDFYRDDVGWIKGTKLSNGKLAAGGLSVLYIWDSIPKAANALPNLTIRNAYYSNGDGVDVVEAAGKLFVNNYNGNNVQVYDPIPTTTSEQPSFVIGSPSVSANTLEKINYIQNPNVATDGKILIATSDFDRTLWLWKTIPTKSGQSPDVKISLRENNDISPWDNALWKNNIVLAGKQKVAVWNQIPINGEKFDYSLQNKIGDVTFNELSGVALDSLYFYLADRNGKISIWKGIPKTGSENSFLTIQLQTGLVPNQIHSDGEYFTITANPPKIYIYKVSEFAQNTTPQPYKTLPITQNLSLNLPSVTITYKGSVAIANNSNNNVIIWKNISDAGDASKAIILGQPSLNNFIPGNSANQLFFPSTLAMFENELWVGEFKFSSRILKFEYPKTANIITEEITPKSFKLFQNYPNPFNSLTIIKYELPNSGFVRLKIYDVLGNEVFVLANEYSTSGIFSKTLNTTKFSSGVYFCKLTLNNYSKSIKLILQK